uniref:Eukaryotic translation initiation factor 3 subunit E n=1 Tax=Leersia perrieri TaxID=77586 RepID=A0A0D9WVX5_9ORYZ
MAEHDLTARMAQHMDCHLVFPLLEFLQQRRLYPNEEILEAKLRLLRGTNMVDYAMDIQKELHGTDDQVLADMVERRAEVVSRLKALDEAIAPVVSLLQNQEGFQQVRDPLAYPPDHGVVSLSFEFQMLIDLDLNILIVSVYLPSRLGDDMCRIAPDQIEILYQYSKFQFDCGNYSEAAVYLDQYRALCTNSEKSLSALWGKLAAEILMQNWDVALEELHRLKETIDSKNFASPLNQIQDRIWLMHWSIFILFNHQNGKNTIIDLFFQDRYLNAMQTMAPHLLRYLAAAFILNKRRDLLNDLLKVIQQEQNSYNDPIIEFLHCLYVRYDFDGARQKLIECEQVILNDPFLGKLNEERNFITVPFRDRFIENGRLIIFGSYCRIHQRIHIGSSSQDDLVDEITCRMPCSLDRFRIMCLCRSWRAFLVAELPPPPQQLPLLLRPSAGGPTFSCLLSGDEETSALHSVRVPEFLRAARFIGSWEGGWVFMAEHRSWGHVLYNLRSGRRVWIPEVVLSPRQAGGGIGFEPVILLAATISGSPEADPCFGAAIVHRWDKAYERREICLWRLGMDRATPPILPVPAFEKLFELQDVIFYHGSFHFLAGSWNLLQCLPLIRADGEVEAPLSLPRHGASGRYLVESRGRLLMVVRSKTSTDFKVYQMSVSEAGVNTWDVLTELEGRMLFIGIGCSRCYEAASFPGFHEGVFFLDDACSLRLFKIRDSSMVFRSLENGRFCSGSVGRCFPPPQAASTYSPPIWVLP